MSNQINKFDNLEFSTSNYINTGEDINIIKKNNNINDR